MNALSLWKPETRWNPIRELESLQSRISNILEMPNVFGNGRKEALTIAEWSPSVDIVENEKEYLIKAELPEIERKDVKVTVQNGILTFSGERRFEREEKGRKYHRIERSYGSFVRSFDLPDDADPEHVEAKFSDGMLTIHVTKNKAAAAKEIEVKTS
jgi:HSP20 family protein